MRRIFTALLTAGAALSAETLAIDVTAAAYETGTIQPAGPRQPPNGNRFFNVEGSSFGVNASYGVVRWDLTQTRADLDTMFGAGNWFVAGVDLIVTQSNAGFTTDGGVRVYYTADDATDCKTTASPLSYPFEDTPGTPDLPVVLADPVGVYSFVEVATGTVDSHPIYRNENSGQRNALASDIETQNTLTLVLVENDDAVAATYAGQTPDAGQNAPTLRIRAVQIGGNIPPYANAGPDQSDEDLDGNGFEAITFNGTASVDLDGTITSYVWREGNTQLATGATPTVNLPVGVHTITLTVTDNGGATDTDTMTVTIVAGPIPTADAGANQEVTDVDNNGVEQVTLDGSASFDVDGFIANYEWREGTTVLGSTASPTLNVNLPIGTHTIRLIVTDDDGQTDIDFVQVDVRPGNVIAGHNFDDLQSYISYTPVPDTNITPFSSAADGFGIFQRFASVSIPFSLLDDTMTNFPTDNLGIVKSKKFDAWFGINDLQNPDNPTGLGTVTWVFNITGHSNLQLRIDMAAMGDFEASGTAGSVADAHIWKYSIDGGPFTTVFSCLPDEAIDNVQYELESGRLPPPLNDPLVVNGTTMLTNNFRTFVANIPGTGNQLTLRLESSNDSDEPYAFDNIFVTTGGGPQCSCTGDIAPSGNPNGAVDLNDLTLLLSNFGIVPADPCINVTGPPGTPIDLNDLTTLLSAFGTTCP